MSWPIRALPGASAGKQWIMEQLVAELKKMLPFKETTEPGDIVLIAAKQPQMLLYAVVGDIVRDETRKAEWWHVTLNLLSLPIQTVVWTLRTPQFTGQEIFTMGGEGRFVQAIRLESRPTGLAPDQPPGPGGKEQTKDSGRRPGLRIVK
ncbi:MAG: hypothetical protein FWF31_06220 [Desulfobulbus sp.]|nr:hypothetical protein [Desulfobulbus sp.]